jgi:hypothetical protein
MQSIDRSLNQRDYLQPKPTKKRKNRTAFAGQGRSLLRGKKMTRREGRTRRKKHEA